MANFSVTQSDGSGFAWQILNLSKAWSYANYYYAGLSKSPFISGTDIGTQTYDYMPWGGNAYPFKSTTPIVATTPYSWMPASIYGTSPVTFYPYVEEVSTSLTWSIGVNGTITAGNAAEAYTFTPTSARPPLFYWYLYGTGYSPQNRTTVGGLLSVYRPTDVAWNALRTNIINMLVYKHIITSTSAFTSYAYYFGTVTRYNSITADIYNKARGCINAMGGSVPSVTRLVTPFTENYFYYLQYYLNLIS